MQGPAKLPKFLSKMTPIKSVTDNAVANMLCGTQGILSQQFEIETGNDSHHFMLNDWTQMHSLHAEYLDTCTYLMLNAWTHMHSLHAEYLDTCTHFIMNIWIYMHSLHTLNEEGILLEPRPSNDASVTALIRKVLDLKEVVLFNTLN